MTLSAPAPPTSISKALQLLGIENLLLGVHDAALPSRAEEETGRGSPYSAGSAEFFRFVRELGFDGIQFGPQGLTSPDNPSPYDGTFFSRNPLSLAPHGLTSGELPFFDPADLTGLIGPGPEQRAHVERFYAAGASRRLTTAACRRYRQMLKETSNPVAGAVVRAFAAFRRRNAEWLEQDALYEILRLAYQGASWQHWQGGSTACLDRQLPAPPSGSETRARQRIMELQQKHADFLDDFAFIQFLLAAQHAGLQAACRSLGLKLFGDFQIGFSERDAWAAQAFLLPGYLLGAPPSRTNPCGQPWNYPLLDPRLYFAGEGEGQQSGPAARFLRRRVDKLLAEFDGLRIDHPHGLICPWVYRAGQADPVQAVQSGARLFASPDLGDHPELAAFAIARPGQLHREAERYADDWVVELETDQVQRYASLFEVVMAAFREKDRGRDRVACEILSTQPYPIQQVMARYGLGRFRVTQKADLANPDDVYRSENSRPEDWLMLGNHDTPSIWQVTRDWLEQGRARPQAAYLADRLGIPAERRPGWVDAAAADSGLLVQAKFADLLVGPARNIMVFFTDLFGMTEAYNRPGSVNEENWSLRVPADYRRVYAERMPRGLALNLPAALALALRARGEGFIARHRTLIADLEALSGTSRT